MFEGSGSEQNLNDTDMGLFGVRIVWYVIGMWYTTSGHFFWALRDAVVGPQSVVTFWALVVVHGL